MSPLVFGVRPPRGDEEQFLLAQQVILARQQMIGLGAVSTVIAIMVAVVFADSAPWPVIVAWGVLAASALSVTWSGIRLQRKKGRMPTDAFRSARKFFYQSLAISTAWGAAYWFTMPAEGVGMQFLIIFLAGGAAAGLVAGYGAMPTIWAPMIVLTVGPPAVQQCLHAGRVDIVTCIGIVLFIAGLAFFGYSAYLAFVRGVRFQFETRRLAEQKSQIEAALEHFFERTNALTAIANPDGSLRRLNPTWQTVFGYEMDEMLGKRTLDFVHPDDVEATQAAAIGTLEGRPIVNQVNRFRAKDGSYRWLQWNAVRDPTDGTILATAADITDREDARAVKEKLVATVSHELRTPLTALQASLQILAAGIAGSVPGPGERMLEIAERNAERLIALTDDILDLERIGAQQMDPQPLRPGILIEECLAELQPMFDSFAVTPEVDDRSGSARLLGDAVRVRQVMHNVLSNAIKFSPLKGTVRIAISADETTVRTVIEDDGPGIPEGDEEKVFERFVQLPRPAGRTIGGTGLGLAIARELMAAMSGTIRAERSDKGARFVFELPRATDAEDAPASEKEAPVTA